MAAFRNEFSWSISRRRLFDRCRRAYWYRYYGHWGGWEAGATAEARLAWVLGKMTSLPMWIGTVVHEVIEQAIEECAATGELAGAETLSGRAVEALRRGWVQSRDRHWERDPKHAVNLLEHYYRRDVPRGTTDRVKADVLRCLGNFAASEAAAWIRASDPADWLNVEALDSFPVGGHKVYIKPDLAVRDGSRVVLYDWKTGRKSGDDLRQLAAYALFARARWGAGPSDVDIRAVYLRDGAVVTAEVDAARLDDVEREIAASMEEMRAPLTDASANVADKERFPMVEDRAGCRECPFQILCFGEAVFGGEEG